MKLTILTPTYNRINKLKELYSSLKKQTCSDFEWFIVDDGSTDDTKTIVNAWIKTDAIIKIKYLKKINGGKHTALNAGIQKIDSELIFIVDSDDKLESNAVETIIHYHNRYYSEDKICGYSFLRAFPDGNINGKKFITNEYIASYITSRVNSNDTHADKAEVFKTKHLKMFPFPEYPNEKFLGEDIVWMQMGKEYLMVHVNKVIYIGEYQDDGLTKNRRINNINSPIGCMNRAKQFMCKEVKVKHRIKATLQYFIYARFAHEKVMSILKKSPDIVMSIILFVPSMFIYYKWKYEYKI